MDYLRFHGIENVWEANGFRLKVVVLRNGGGRIPIEDGRYGVGYVDSMPYNVHLYLDRDASDGICISSTVSKYHVQGWNGIEKFIKEAARWQPQVPTVASSNAICETIKSHIVDEIMRLNDGIEIATPFTVDFDASTETVKEEKKPEYLSW